jgi:hypothetical protein
MSSKFQIPEIINPDKVLAESTMKLYKTKLNKLAKNNIKSVSDVLNNQKRVIEIAKEDAGNNNHKMRTFLSAVFWVLADTDISRKIELYNEFQRHKEENQKFL